MSFPSVRTERDVSRLAQEVFALPARLADARKRKVVVALDEFQAIGGFNGGSVEHALRAAVQQQRDVGYVFAGSEPTPDGADAQRRSGRSTRPARSCGSRRFRPTNSPRSSRRGSRASGIKPEAGLGAAIVELAGNLPYDVQRLAHETWDEVRDGGRRRATLDDLHQALKRLLSEQQMMFEGVWQRLTLAQRAVLRAVVLEDGRELLSADVRTRHRLGGPSTRAGRARRADARRRHQPRRDRYVVVDSLLREWVARQTF